MLSINKNSSWSPVLIFVLTRKCSVKPKITYFHDTNKNQYLDLLRQPLLPYNHVNIKLNT